MKLLEKYTEINFGDLGFGNEFLDMTAKAQMQKQDFIKIKHFCSSKNTKKVKRPTKWKTIIANNISEKGLIPRRYKECLQLDNNLV